MVRVERIRARRVSAAGPAGPGRWKCSAGFRCPPSGEAPGRRVPGPRPVEARGSASAWGRERVLGLQLAHLAGGAREPGASLGRAGWGEGLHVPKSRPRSSGESLVNQTNRSCGDSVEVEERPRGGGKGVCEFGAKPGLREVLAAPAPVPASPSSAFRAHCARGVEEG